MKRSLLIALALFASVAGQARADATSAIQSFTNGIVWPNNDNEDYSLGYEFAVSTPVTVSALGYNYFGTPLNSSHSVGIFDSSTNLLASVTVDNSSTVSDGYLYTSLTTPVVLAPGDYFISGTTLGLNDGWLYQASDIVTAPGIAYVESFFTAGNGGQLLFPSTDAPGRQYLTVNFQIGSATVPEPSTFILLAIGMTGYGFTRLRRALPD
jgi:hypothetical protein